MRTFFTILLLAFLWLPLGGQVKLPPPGGGGSIVPYTTWLFGVATGNLSTGTFTDGYTYAIAVGDSPTHVPFTSFNVRWKVGGVAQAGKTWSECGIGYSSTLPVGAAATTDITIVHAQDCDMTATNTVVASTVAAAVPVGKFLWVILSQSGSAANPQPVTDDDGGLGVEMRTGHQCVNTSLQPTTVDDGGAAFTCTNSGLFVPWVAVLPS